MSETNYSSTNQNKAEQATSSKVFSKQLRRFALTIMPIMVGLHLYIGWRLLPALPIDALATRIGWSLLGLSTVLIPLGMFARFFNLQPDLVDRISGLGSFVMGGFSSILVLTLLRDIVLLAYHTPRFVENTAIAVIVVATLVTLVGYINARRVAKVIRIDIPLNNLPASLEGFTIAQISDIHVGPTIKANYVQAIVDRVNSLKADLIAITGDVVDGSVSQLSTHTAPLAELKAQHGTYIVTGNHEYYSGASEWVNEFQRLGLKSLMNEHVIVEHKGAQLVIAGVTDFSAHLFVPEQKSDPFAALNGSPKDIHKILLAHQPRTATKAAAAGFDLQLSGHTHGGQFWPWNLFVVFQQPFTAGLHKLDQLWVYTSRGTGYWGPPKRFGAPSEITLLQLVTDSVDRD